MPTPPREPEIELLGKLAHGMLLVIRAALWGGGVFALAQGFQQMVDPEQPDLLSMAAHSDQGAVWIAVGLPLAVPSRWILTWGRAAKIMLAILAVLWFAPLWLENDSPYGYVLRMFATLISVLSMLVWRTLWRLTQAENKAT